MFQILMISMIIFCFLSLNFCLNPFFLYSFLFVLLFIHNDFLFLFIAIICSMYLHRIDLIFFISCNLYFLIKWLKVFLINYLIICNFLNDYTILIYDLFVKELEFLTFLRYHYDNIFFISFSKINFFNNFVMI
jgi:hypothetical protein